MSLKRVRRNAFGPLFSSLKQESKRGRWSIRSRSDPTTRLCPFRSTLSVGLAIPPASCEHEPFAVSSGFGASGCSETTTASISGVPICHEKDPSALSPLRAGTLLASLCQQCPQVFAHRSCPVQLLSAVSEVGAVPQSSNSGQRLARTAVAMDSEPLPASRRRSAALHVEPRAWYQPFVDSDPASEQVMGSFREGVQGG